MHNVLGMNLAKIIRQKRKQKAMTQVELAYQTGISLPTIQNIEAGKANPSLKTIEALFDVLNVKLLLTKENEMEYDWLVELGVPLPQKRRAPLREDLIQYGDRLLARFLMCKSQSQEYAAFAAYFSCLQDHYPDIFNQICRQQQAKVEQAIMKVPVQTLVILKTRALAKLQKLLGEEPAKQPPLSSYSK